LDYAQLFRESLAARAAVQTSDESGL
jgi:hypothetical protein